MKIAALRLLFCNAFIIVEFLEFVVIAVVATFRNLYSPIEWEIKALNLNSPEPWQFTEYPICDLLLPDLSVGVGQVGFVASYDNGNVL